MKMFVYEISGIRNLQYDIDKLTQVREFSLKFPRISLKIRDFIRKSNKSTRKKTSRTL